jgi:S1-C subfamily serine protease
MLIALVALSIFGGYRRGAVLQVIGLTGLALGAFAGALLAPRIAHLGNDPMTHVALALGAVVVGAAIGNLVGWLVGSRLRSRAHGQRFARADAVAGSMVSVLALLLVTWFLALNLVNGPFPQLARGIRSSKIVQGLDAVMPPPPSLLGEAQRVLGMLGFPDVFVGIPPAPAEPVPPPAGAGVRRAFRAAAPSTYEILGRGCYQGFLNQGTGFVVRPGLVVTNAHVVAGTTDQWVHAADTDYGASVVLFDPRMDIAVLSVPDLPGPPLPLLAGQLARGAGGAVLGYPGGGALTTSAAAVRQVIHPVGRDIYGEGEVTRELYEVQAQIHQGNSGGPFVLPDGRVAGVVFASSVIDDSVGYAIASTEVAPLVSRAATRTTPVGDGTCAN